MSLGIKFSKKVIIAIEGADFFHLIREAGNNLESGIQLFDFKDSKQGPNFDRFIRKFCNRIDDDDSEVKCLGVICDAEDNANDEFARRIKDLEKHKLPSPRKNGEITAVDGFAVGVLTVPVGENEGCIENSLLEAVKEKELLTCAEDFQKCAEEIWSRKGVNMRDDEKSLERWRSKSKVHAMIAGCETPESTLGVSVQKQLWDFEQRPLKLINEFIESLRQFAKEN